MTVEGVILKDLVANLDAAFPGIADRLVGLDGELEPFVSVILPEGRPCPLRAMTAPVPPGQAVWIVPTFAGE